MMIILIKIIVGSASWGGARTVGRDTKTAEQLEFRELSSDIPIIHVYTVYIYIKYIIYRIIIYFYLYYEQYNIYVF